MYGPSTSKITAHVIFILPFASVSGPATGGALKVNNLEGCVMN